MGGIGLDLTQRIINVHWGGPAVFLYSGADGMFGSRDGENWKQAPSSVPAISLAWANDVWVACGPSGTWRSEDGAKTWQSSGPQLRQVVAIKSTGLDSEGKPLPGMFAGFANEESGDVVYTSDNGASWSSTLTIPTNFGDGGTESITALSGCGNAFFVGAVHSPNSFSPDSAKFYSSFGGGGFSSQTVATGTFWDGDSDNKPGEFIGYGARGVGYDQKTKMFLATLDKENTPSSGVLRSSMQASQSGSGSFDEGSPVAQATLDAFGFGDFIGVYPYVAGGDGTFVGGSSLSHFTPALTGGEVRAHWLPGGSEQTLASYTGEGLPEIFIGSFCFKQQSDTEESTDSPEPGVFACVAYGAGADGGVYIATAGGSFRKTHSGRGIQNEGAGQPAGAVAVGKIKFLGSADAGL